MDSIMRLLQFTDSTFPVGTFSFSNGLESAGYEKLVHDSRTLEEYTRSIALQAAYSDGVVAILCHRAAQREDYEALREADERLLEFKMNAEARLMLQRMGKKLAELGVRLFPDNMLIARFLDDVNKGEIPGCYPVAQGLVFSAGGITEKDLFCSHQYGVINMVLSAALRCVRVSHYDTQMILYRLGLETEGMYDKARLMTLDDMQSFVPEIDIIASMHEKGNMRMFMN